MDPDLSEIIGKMYDAKFERNAWNSVLKHLAEYFNAEAVMLERASSTSNCEENFCYTYGYPLKNPRHTLKFDLIKTDHSTTRLTLIKAWRVL